MTSRRSLKMRKTFLVFACAIVLAGCGPSAEEIAAQTAEAWTATPRITPTSKPANTLTPETAGSYKISCQHRIILGDYPQVALGGEEHQVVSAGRPLLLSMYWWADNTELVEQNINQMALRLEINGQKVDTGESWGGIAKWKDIDNDGDADSISFWRCLIPEIFEGSIQLNIESEYLSEISDGLDFNGDGEPETYSGITRKTISVIFE